MRSVHSVLSVGLVCCALCSSRLAAGTMVDPFLDDMRSDAAGSVLPGASLVTSSDLSAYLTSATAASTYATTAALSAKAAAADVTALQARATVTEQNLALVTWDLWAHLGLPGQGWTQGWVDPCQDATGMALITNAYKGTGMWSTVVPGTVDLCTSGSASANDSDGPYVASNAFDNDNNTCWSTNTGPNWLKYDFGVGATHAVMGYSLFVKSDYPTYAPKTWTFEGSNNNTDWTTLDTQTNITTWSLKNTYTFTNAVAYRYVRWNITATNNGGGYSIISEAEAFAPGTSAITLRTVTSTAATSPTHGSMFVCAKELEAVTLNTDVIAKISKVGAFASPVTLTLTKLLTIGAYSYYYGEADYNAGTGVTMQAEIATTAKGIEIYRVSHNWR